MTIAIDAMFSVWGDTAGWVALPTRKNNKWDDQHFFEWPQDKEAIVEHINKSNDRDLYWCPTVLTDPWRDKTAVKSVNLLWADLDEVDPRKVEKRLRPSVAWESSPGRFAALWVLDKFIPADQAEKLNRRLTYHLGADKGGWDITQVLRVPGSRNYKYEGAPSGKLLWNKQQVVYGEGAFSHLKEVQGEDDLLDAPSVGEVNDDGRSPQEILAPFSGRVPARVYELIFADPASVEVGARSDRLWELECRLAELGMDAGAIANVCRRSPYNKFQGRNTEWRQLLTEAGKAVKHVHGIPITQGTHSGEDDNNDHEWVNYTDFMGMDLSKQSWLVEDIWMESSHGLISGEPKAYKSWLAAELAVSVASGKPFLGKFTVHKRGPVLMVEEENAPWIVQDRLRKIVNARGLLKGTVDSTGISFPPSLPVKILAHAGLNLREDESKELLETEIINTRPILLILDSLYLVLGDINENQANEIRPVLQWLLRIRYKYNVAIAVVHHWNKNGASERGGQRMLGSTIIHGWVESAMHVRLRDQNEVSVEREFRAYGRPPLTVKFDMGDPGNLKYSTTVTDGVATTDDVIGVLATSNGMKLKEIAAALKITLAQARGRLDEAQRNGHVLTRHKGRATIYSLIKKGVT